MVAIEISQVLSNMNSLGGDLAHKFISGCSEVSVGQPQHLVSSHVVPEQGGPPDKEF